MNTKYFISSIAKAALVGMLLASPFVASADNPIPSVNSVSPTSQVSGGGNFTLTVNGNNFVPGAVVYFNGSPRSTTYVSANQLISTINASDLASVGNYNISVTNPTPGGGVSNNTTFTVSSAGNNPIPGVASISPTFRAVNSGAFNITVNGTNFVPSSSVSYNGISRPTTYVSANQLMATIPASDVATTGTFLVAVTNPTPAGGLSNYVAFQVTGLGTTPQLPNTGFGPTQEPSSMLALGIGLTLALALAAGWKVKHHLAQR